MAQLFHPSTNTFSKVSIFGAVFFLAVLAWVFGVLIRSPFATDASVVRPQPVPFSHEHHVNALGIDCRYCHTSADTSSFAGIPPTKTCMTCHSQIFTDSEILEPVRESFRTDMPIAWTRVHDLPDFAYFNHSIHLHKGIGCTTCHGQVDRMPLMWAENALNMEWCLHCHRNPEKFIRPRDQVWNVAYRVPDNQQEIGPALVKEYQVDTTGALTNCSICHR